MDNEFILIPQARFIYRVQHRTMEGDCQYDHGPRVVHLNPFFISKYPVTNEMYKEFIDDSGYCPADATNYLRHWQNGIYPAEIKDHPVVWVSQSDARAYAQWAGGRLPFDTEWQYAACGDKKIKWPWGNIYIAGYCNGHNTHTTPVDRYPKGASPFGCLDMCGNTWEWTGETIDDGYHIFALIRGGSFYKAEDRWHVDGGPKPNDFHWKFQLLNEGLNRCATIGFRIVKDIDYDCS